MQPMVFRDCARQLLSNFWHLEKLFSFLATFSNFWILEQRLGNFVLICLIKVTLWKETSISVKNATQGTGYLENKYLENNYVARCCSYVKSSSQAIFASHHFLVTFQISIHPENIHFWVIYWTFLRGNWTLKSTSFKV